MLILFNMRSFFAKIESKANSKFIQFIMQRKTFVEKNYSKLFVICFYTESMPHMKQNKNSNFLSYWHILVEFYAYFFINNNNYISCKHRDKNVKTLKHKMYLLIGISLIKHLYIIEYMILCNINYRTEGLNNQIIK